MANSNIELEVAGMTCGGCVRSVEIKLTKVPGVESVRVDLAAGKAAVAYDNAKTNVDQLIVAVEQIGFHAKA